MKQMFNLKLLSFKTEGKSVRFQLKAAMVLILISSFTTNANEFEDLNAISSDVKNSMNQQTITGTVTDQSGSPLPGVNIIIVGATIGAQTDFDGNFSIVASDGDILEFSYIGMKTAKVTISNQTKLNISMEEDADLLDEVVVVGYGTQSKTSLSGSVQAVQSQELVKAATSTATELLAGRVSGLITKQTAGTPGSDALNVSIRGFGNALILVDGIQTEMTRIDPNDIESVSVLKDASAAVYGSRAGNGVILVTTKRGKAGKTKISYHGSTSFQSPTKSRNYVDSWEYATLIREADLNGGSLIDDTYTEEDVEKFRSGTDPNYVNQDWNAAVFTKEVPMMQHNLNVRGGSEKVKYFASAGFMDQASAYRSGDLNFKRYNVRTNLDVEINDHLSFGADLSYRRENRDSPATNPSTMYNLLQTAQPVYSAFLPDPDRAAYSGFTTRSPYAATQKRLCCYPKAFWWI
jgi:TonB-linked SusC/RagA family outer membrane protein